jgi:hypothetical protein
LNTCFLLAANATDTCTKTMVANHSRPYHNKKITIEILERDGVLSMTFTYGTMTILGPLLWSGIFICGCYHTDALSQAEPSDASAGDTDKDTDADTDSDTNTDTDTGMDTDTDTDTDMDTDPVLADDCTWEQLQPELPVETLGLGSVWASGPDDIWGTYESPSGAGKVLHFDGNAWNDETSNFADDPFAVWGFARDDVFMLADVASDDHLVRLYHFDGTSWSALDINIESCGNHVSWVHPADAEVLFMNICEDWQDCDAEFCKCALWRYDGSQFDRINLTKGTISGLQSSDRDNVFALVVDDTWVSEGDPPELDPNELHRLDGTTFRAVDLPAHREPTDQMAVLGPGNGFFVMTHTFQKSRQYVYQLDAGTWRDTGFPCTGYDVKIAGASVTDIVAAGLYQEITGWHLRIFSYDGSAWHQIGDKLPWDYTPRWVMTGTDEALLMSNGAFLYRSGDQLTSIGREALGPLIDICGDGNGRLDAIGSTLVSRGGEGWSVTDLPGAGDPAHYSSALWRSGPDALHVAGIRGPVIHTFDGAKWSTVDLYGSLGYREILAATQLLDGRLLAQVAVETDAYSTELWTHDGTSWSPLASPSPPVPFEGLWAASTGVIWGLEGTTRIWHFDAGGAWSVALERPDETITALAGIASARVYAVAESGSIWTYAGDVFEDVGPDISPFPEGTVGPFCARDVDELYLMVNEPAVECYWWNCYRPWRYDGTAWQPYQVDLRAPAADIWADSGGSVYLVNGASDSKVDKVDGTSWTRLDGSDGYNLHRIQGLADGSIVATRGQSADLGKNVQWFDGSAWHHETFGELPFNLPSVTETPEALFAYTFEGTVAYYAGGTWTIFDQPGGPNPCTRINDLWGAPDGFLMAACDGGSVLIREDGKWRAEVAPKEGDWKVIAGTSKENIYVGGDHGRLVHWDGTAFAVIDTIGAMNNRKILSLALDSAGNLYATNIDGRAYVRKSGEDHWSQFIAWGNEIRKLFGVGEEVLALGMNEDREATIWKIAPGGISEARLSPPFGYYVNGLWSDSHQEIFAVDHLGAVVQITCQW